MQAIIWNTGRTYSAHGQRMAAVILPGQALIAFADADRQIYATVHCDKDELLSQPEITATAKKIVMREYDHGHYEDIGLANAAKAFNMTGERLRQTLVGCATIGAVNDLHEHEAENDSMFIGQLN